MGKKRIIAETGAGMHGVATATVAARFGLDCVIYMGTTDIERQQANVFRMKLLGAEVIPVVAGTGTLKDAMNEALRDWVTNVDSTFYLIGTVAGPHPYPAMVRDFQAVIGKETREQLLAQEGRLPDSLVACIGGGSNAMGLFHPFLDDQSVEIIGVEAAGYGIETGKHAASLNGGVPGCCTVTVPSCCRTTMARSSTPTRFPPVSIIRALALSTPGCMTSAAFSTPRSPTTKPSLRSTSAAASKASSRHWKALMRWLKCSSARRNCRRIT